MKKKMQHGIIPNELILNSLKLDNMNSLGGGYLDWVTGTMRINFSSNDYDKIKNGDLHLWKKYLETTIHEMFHFFQIVTSGYMYNYSLDITNEMVDLYFSKNISLSEYFIKNHFPTKTKQLINLTKKIDELEQNIIAPIHLIEGMALFAQWTHATEEGRELMNPDFFFSRVINFYNRTNSYYSKAYTILYKKLGNNKAFYIFPCIIHYCLQLSHPAYAFLNITNKIAEFSEYISENFDENFEKLQNIFNYILSHQEHPEKFGIVECPLYIKEDNHPFFADFFIKLHQSEEFHPNDIINAVINPNKITQDLFLEFLRPALLNDGLLIISQDNDIGIFNTREQLEDIIKVSCAINYQIISKHNVGLKLDTLIDMKSI